MKKNKSFLAFVVPSVLGFALSGIYTIVDGFFIGQCLGDNGLAAVTLGFPVSSFIQSVGTGLGLAGAIQFAIFKAQEKQRDEQECFTSASILMVLVSVILTGLLYCITEPLIHLLGASGEIFTMTVEYVHVIVYGTVFQLLATGLVPFIRNMGGATFAMVSMILGFIVNIILDYLFVWVLPWGMQGGAAATVIGQAVTMFCAVGYFVHKKYKLKLSNIGKMAKLWANIFKVSLSPFGMSFSQQLTLLIMNRYLIAYGDSQAVAIYGCIDYILSIIYFLIQGVGDGSQPLISECYGKSDFDGVRSMRKKAYTFAEAITAVCLILVFIFRSKIGVLFGASAESNIGVAYYLPWFLATILLLCFSRITTTYFYASEKTVFSYVLVYGESVFTLLMLCILPRFSGLTGVWLSMPLAQMIVFIIAFVLKSIADKDLKKANNIS